MTTLTTLIPPDFRFRTMILVWVLGAVLGFQVFSDSAIDWASLAGIALLLTSISAADLWVRMTYRVRFDDHNLYWRKRGFWRGERFETALPLAQIAEVEALSGTGIEVPFEGAAIYLQGHREPTVLLTAMHLSRDDMALCIDHIAARSKAIISPAVGEFLADYHATPSEYRPRG